MSIGLIQAIPVRRYFDIIGMFAFSLLFWGLTLLFLYHIVTTIKTTITIDVHGLKILSSSIIYKKMLSDNVIQKSQYLLPWSSIGSVVYRKKYYAKRNDAGEVSFKGPRKIYLLTSSGKQVELPNLSSVEEFLEQLSLVFDSGKIVNLEKFKDVTR
jgi:hypothetical protein